MKNDWPSERILFGLLIIFGFFLMGALVVVMPLTADARQSGKDVLLVVGPLLGVIVNAIWKQDKTEKQAADSIATLSSAVTKAMDMPAAGPPA